MTAFSSIKHAEFRKKKYRCMTQTVEHGLLNSKTLNNWKNMLILNGNGLKCSKKRKITEH